MTREEAIQHLGNIIIFSYQDGYSDEAREALKMAIAALKAEPCEDAVSLDAVINTIEWYRTNPQHFTEDNLIEDMKGLTPVTPKPRTGKWINNHTQCSICEWGMEDDVVGSAMMLFFPYCPNCGAKMEGGE